MKWWRLPLLIVNFVLWFYLATLVFSYCVLVDYALVNFLILAFSHAVALSALDALHSPDLRLLAPAD